MGATAGVILFAYGCSSSLAQDFYNGCRGPRALQIDTYVKHSQGKTSGTLISKLFTKNLHPSLPDLLLASPFSVSERGEVDNKGVNIGYITEGKNVNVIGAVGLFRNDEGKYGVLTPQVYITNMQGPWTFDLEGNLPIHLNNHKHEASTSLTVGYRINDTLRLGTSITKETNSDLEYKANARIELSNDHKYWIQGYLGENSIEFRLALNF